MVPLPASLSMFGVAASPPYAPRSMRAQSSTNIKTIFGLSNWADAEDIIQEKNIVHLA